MALHVPSAALVESLREHIISGTLDVDFVNERLAPWAKIVVKNGPTASLHTNTRTSKSARVGKPLKSPTPAVVVRRSNRNIPIKMQLSPSRLKAVLASPSRITERIPQTKRVFMEKQVKRSMIIKIHLDPTQLKAIIASLSRVTERIPQTKRVFVEKQVKRSMIIKIHLDPTQLKAIVASPSRIMGAADSLSNSTFLGTAHELNDDHLHATSTIQTGMQSPLREYLDAVKVSNEGGPGLETPDKMETSRSSTPVRFHTPAPWGWQTPPHGPAWSEFEDVQSIQDGDFDNDTFGLPDDSLEGSRASPMDHSHQSDPSSRLDAYGTVPYHRSFEHETSPSQPERSKSASNVSSIIPYSQGARKESGSNALERLSTLLSSSRKPRFQGRGALTQSSLQKRPMEKCKKVTVYGKEEKRWILHYLRIEMARGTSLNLSWDHISKKLTKHGLRRSAASIRVWWYRHPSLRASSNKKQPRCENVFEKDKTCSDTYGEEEKQLIPKSLTDDVAGEEELRSDGEGDFGRAERRHPSKSIVGYENPAYTISNRPQLPQQSSFKQISMGRKRQAEDYKGEVEVADSVGDDEEVEGKSLRRTSTRPIRDPKRYRVTEDFRRVRARSLPAEER
ncbi:MAG: hypothetical protein Q9182_004523 [Xanthomendoza sp. 2 TL-2023]